MTHPEIKQPYVRFFVSDWLGATRGMKANEIGVYITLLMLMYERAAPLQDNPERLSRQCGLSPKTLIPILEMLVDDGKILRTDDGLWNARVEKEFAFRQKKSEVNSGAAKSRWQKDSENNDTPMRTHSDGSAAVVPIPEARLREDANASSKRAESERAQREFDAWWALYPNKVGKPAALKSFATARRKADADTLMAGLRTYIETKPIDRQWLNPATWLNQERWTDQPANVVALPTRNPTTQQTGRRTAGMVLADMARELHQNPATESRHDGPTIDHDPSQVSKLLL